MLKDGEFVAVLIYVDDLLVTGNSLPLITTTKAFLHTQFKIKDLGNMKYFLGLEVARSFAGIYLRRKKYILDILSDDGLTAAKPSAVPMDQNHTLLEASLLCLKLLMSRFIDV